MDTSGTEHAGVSGALYRARRAAQKHMAAAEMSPGMEWHEETLTDLFLLEAQPDLLFQTFTKRQESDIGADWLWWWVDDAGECFGMLVQAKRLRGAGGAPEKTVDFRYRSGQQHRAMGLAADILGVPAVYVVYMGDSTYRLPMTCGDASHSEHCERCDRWSVAMITWLMASMASNTGRGGASAVFNDGFPIEDLGDRYLDSSSILDLNLANCDPDLRSFLLRPQTGARLIAKTVLRAVAQARRGMFSVDTVEPVRTVAGRVFPVVPADSAHFGRPYLDHILRGLRRNLPGYVEELRAGLPISDELSELVDGVALFRC